MKYLDDFLSLWPMTTKLVFSIWSEMPWVRGLLKTGNHLADLSSKPFIFYSSMKMFGWSVCALDELYKGATTTDEQIRSKLIDKLYFKEIVLDTIRNEYHEVRWSFTDNGQEAMQLVHCWKPQSQLYFQLCWAWSSSNGALLGLNHVWYLESLMVRFSDQKAQALWERSINGVDLGNR